MLLTTAAEVGYVATPTVGRSGKAAKVIGRAMGLIAALEKAMPAILRSAEEVNLWMNAPMTEVLAL